MNNFDERQLWVRGNVFKHAVMLLGILIFLDAIYASYTKDSHLFGAVTGIVMFMFVSMIAGIEMVKKQAYDGYKGDGTIGGIILVVVSGGVTIVRFLNFMSDGITMSTLDGRETIGMFLITIFLFIFACYYLYHLHLYKKDVEEA